jgi:hypothetical protein
MCVYQHFWFCPYPSLLMCPGKEQFGKELSLFIIIYPPVVKTLYIVKREEVQGRTYRKLSSRSWVKNKRGIKGMEEEGLKGVS